MKRATRPLDLFYAAAVSVGVFAVYAATMCRTIYTGDDGDFITAMATFGVPHPTGYPLFCLLGRLFLVLLPWGSPAYKINLMTALFGAVSVGMLYRFLAIPLAPRGHRAIAACAALLFAFAPTMWQQSLSCEVYSLTALFLAALLYLAARFAEAPRENRRLFELTFVYGLALTNHMTTALLFPAFLAFVLYHRPALFGREGRLLLPMAGLFLLPLSLYVYLPLAARSGAPVNWGLPDNWEAFRLHITGDAFHRLMFRSVEVPLKQGPAYLRLLRAEYGIPLLCLVPVGIAALWRGTTVGNAPALTLPLFGTRRESRSLCALLLALWLITVFYAINYEIFDIYVYYIPSYLAAACLMAFGASTLITAAQDWRGVRAEDRVRVIPLIAVVALILPILQVSLHATENDQSANYLAEDFAANVLRSAPPGALVVTDDDLCYALWYHRFVLKERTDVVPIHQGLLRGMLFWNAWYGKHLARMYPDVVRTDQGLPLDTVYARLRSGDFLIDLMTRAVQQGVPVLVVPDPRYDDQAEAGFHPAFRDQMRASGLVAVPWGLCDRLFLKGHTPPPADVVAINRRMRATFQTRGLYDGSGVAFQDPMQIHIPRRYLDADAEFAAVAEQAGEYEVAIDALERARKLNDWPELRQLEKRCRHEAAARGKVPL